MRRLLSIALAVLMLLSAATVGVFTVSAEDTESDTSSEVTEDVTSEIPENATPVSSYVDFTMMTKTGVYYLAADFSISNSYSSTFSGTLYGNGHTITASAPLFATLNGATIKDLKIEGEIWDESTAATYIGTVASAAGNTVIENVVSNVKIIGGEKTSAGGIVGFARGGSDITILNCVNSGDIEVGQYAGGILVYSEADNTIVKNCTNNGACTSTGNKDAGGIIGVVASSEGVIELANCINNGDCYGNRPGGIISVTENIRVVTIEDCVNTGYILTETNYCGGIAGRIDSKTPTIYRGCVNTGDVEILKSQGGGMIGYSGSSNDGNGWFKFYGCVNTGNISITNANKESNTNSGKLGGLVGAISGTGEFYSCVNTGDVTGNASAGGIAGAIGSGAGNLKGRGAHQMFSCANFGNIHNTGFKGGRTENAASLISYAWGDLHTANNVAAGTVKGDFNTEVAMDQKRMAAGVVGYSNNGGGRYQNNYVLADLDAGSEGVAVAMGNFLSSDVTWTNQIGNKINGNYAVTKLPYLYGQNNGVCVFECPTIDKTLYDTDEEICALLNKLIGYTAFVVVTEEDANEFGLVGVMPVSVLTVGNGAADKEAAPVGTAEEFLAMDPAGSYYLTADITLTESYKGAFSGKLDGKGFKLTLSAPAFELLTNAEISNLDLYGSIELTNTYYAVVYRLSDYAGALAQIAGAGVYTNVKNFATVKAFSEVGGLVGRAYNGLYVDCVNYGTIQGNNATGGIVGEAVGGVIKFENCVNNGLITKYNFNANMYGGIIGRSEYADVVANNCVNNGVINASQIYSKAGGILGYAYGCRRLLTSSSSNTDRAVPSTIITLNNCVNNANVTGGDQTGGIIGWCEATGNLTNCVNNGDIRSQQNYAGGIIARAGSNAGQSKYVTTLTGCVNTGDISAHRQYVGGIVAYSQENLKLVSCINSGNVSGDDITCVKKCRDRGCHATDSWNWFVAGGIVGRTNYEVKAYNCVNTGNVSGSQAVGGIAGEVGVSAAKGATGLVEFLRCVNTGNVYNTNLNSISAKAKHNNGTGGIFGTVFVDPALAGKGMNVDACIVVNCTITADKTEGVGIKAIGGIGGVADAARATYSNNIVMCDLVDTAGNGIKSAIVFAFMSNLDAKNFTNNYVLHTIPTLFYDTDGRNSVENVAMRDGLASGEIAYLINQAAGKNVFFQKIGVDAMPTAIPGENPAIIYYDWQNDCYVNEYVEPKPVETTTEEPEATTKAPDVVTTEPDVVTTEPDVVTTEPDVVTTEPDVVTTAPEADVTTAEPEADVTTADPAGTESPSDDEGGCGGVIGATFAVVALALVAPAALVLKKKED